MQTNKESPLSTKPTPPLSPALLYEKFNISNCSGPMFVTYQRDDGYYSMIDINKIASLSCRGELIIIDFDRINMLSLSISEYSRIRERCRDTKIRILPPPDKFEIGKGE